jgi:glutamate/tyrosine decarboxylase-like PLP-dependent enzyme
VGDASALLRDACERSLGYLSGASERSVAPPDDAVAELCRLDPGFPERGMAPDQVMRLLDEVGSPATVTCGGPRYFGFVIGGSLPVTLAARWLADTWDQNIGLRVISPTCAELEEISLRWLAEVFDLPSTGGSFVTGCSMANFSALAAARHALLKRHGWDVEAKGLYGAPPLKVVVGAGAHMSITKGLGLLGLGHERVFTVPVDDQGRMLASAMPELDEDTIVCLQAGNVDGGSFDPIAEVASRAKAAGAWVHIDGAFGLWARAVPELAHLANGCELADSWAVDAHKWLNVPYDCGICLMRDASLLRDAMTIAAPYLTPGDRREPSHYTPELSRRSRGVEVWAALLSLGRDGVADLVRESCSHARRFAAALSDAGYEVMNEVVLNQVLVSFGDDEKTRRVVAELQRDGTCWVGTTVRNGRVAMRISVVNWSTTAEDVETSIAAMVRVARL